MAIPASLQKKLEGMTPEQLQEVEQYAEDCEKRMGAQEDEAGERAEDAEADSVGGKTMLHNSYRGTK